MKIDKQIDNKKQQLGNGELLLGKEREICKNIYHERLDKMDESSKKIHYGDMKFIVNSSGLENDFSNLKDPLAFLTMLKNVKY